MTAVPCHHGHCPLAVENPSPDTHRGNADRELAVGSPDLKAFFRHKVRRASATLPKAFAPDAPLGFVPPVDIDIESR